MASFDKCFPVTLKIEGGNDNDPDDPGGRTSRGIIQREYDTYCARHGLQHGDVWRATDDVIRDIYRENYWSRIRGDTLDDGVAMCLFDAAVLNGVGQTAKWVQRALGPLYTGDVDGDFGPKTFDGLRQVNDNDVLIANVCARRIGMMQGLDTWWKYKGGWTDRVAFIKATSQAWATGSVGPDMPVITATPKAKPADLVKPAVSQGVANATVAVPVIVGGVATVIKTASDVAQTAADAAVQLQPLASVWPMIGTICAVLTVAGVVLGLYVSYATRRHAAQLNGTATATVGI